MAVQQADLQQAPAAGQKPQPGQPRMEERGVVRRPSPAFLSPFSVLQRFFMDDIAALFDQRGIGAWRATQSRDTGRDMKMDRPAWDPEIDVMQRDNKLVVHADLPGMKPDDVVVEVSNDAITISGERREEREEDRGSIYRFERNYGAFFRVIPLPEGAIVDQAKASFKDGVLEITIPAPPEQLSRGRRLEISRADTNKDTTNQNAKPEEKRS